MTKPPTAVELANKIMLPTSQADEEWDGDECANVLCVRTPEDEYGLTDYAFGIGKEDVTLLAQAVLDLTAENEKLNAELDSDVDVKILACENCAEQSLAIKEAEEIIKYWQMLSVREGLYGSKDKCDEWLEKWGSK